MKLRTLEALIEEILINNVETRKDDFILMEKVIEKMGIDTNISFKSMLLFHKELKLPPFESITRCRRKVQEMNPELKDEETAMVREEQMEEYIQYALNIGDDK